MKGKLGLLIALSLVIGAVGLRLLPHPANFAPMAAIAIFGGAVLPRRLAVWVPLAAMAISDLIIGFYDIMPVVWVCFALIAIGSNYLLQKLTFMRGLAVTLAASLFFFVTTNFAVWTASGMYAHTWNGIVQCYALALPFFRNTLLSDLLYTGGLFGTFGVANLLIRLAIRPMEQPA